MLDIREILRRLRLEETERRIARDLGVSRNTVSKYKSWAEVQGFLAPDLALPDLQTLQAALPSDPIVATPGPQSTVAPHQATVAKLLGAGVEARAIFQILTEQHGFTGDYCAVKRYVRGLRAREPEAFVRVEVEPGQEAQVDFGSAGMLLDSARGIVRRAWVFVMTLAHSRHQFARIVFDQSLATWCDCHIRAFEFFGGVVVRVVVDNLKAAITRAVVHDPIATRAYREVAEHYVFAISPCRPWTPRHKGKVEKGGVHYVKRNALAGRIFRDEIEANEYLLRWCETTAGMRDHGTTHWRPIERFLEVEKPALQPLPATRGEPVEWKLVKLHPDCHVVFDRAYYSVPHRYIGQTLWLRATGDRVEIFREHERVATHARAKVAGQRRTETDHLPPNKVAGLMAAPQLVRERAAGIGPAATELTERLLGERPLDRLRTAQGILKLAERFGAARLEAACHRALAYDEVGYWTIRKILERGMEAAAIESPDRGPIPRTAVYARPAQDILDPRRTTWN